MNNINEKLRKLRIEDFIWIVYFFIAAAALYSNKDERDYLLYNNKKAYHEKKTINITIFVIALIIYIYFVLNTTEDLAKIPQNFNNQAYVDRFAQLVAALLFLAGGIIYLIVEIRDPEPGEISII